MREGLKGRGTQGTRDSSDEGLGTWAGIKGWGRRTEKPAADSGQMTSATHPPKTRMPALMFSQRPKTNYTIRSVLHPARELPNSGEHPAWGGRFPPSCFSGRLLFRRVPRLLFRRVSTQMSQNRVVTPVAELASPFPLSSFNGPASTAQPYLSLFGIGGPILEIPSILPP